MAISSSRAELLRVTKVTDTYFIDIECRGVLVPPSPQIWYHTLRPKIKQGTALCIEGMAYPRAQCKGMFLLKQGQHKVKKGQNNRKTGQK